MKSIHFNICICIASILLIAASCSPKEHLSKDKKVWAWYAGKTTFSPEKWDSTFAKISEAGVNAVILECHGGYPEVLGDTLALRDSAAIQIIKNALPHAQKHNIELHAWIWTANRTEQSYRRAHPNLYQINAQGESCLDIKLYNREHYRWLCPSRQENINYLKDRVRELAQIEGLAGVHLDFIRYPDAILPYALGLLLLPYLPTKL